MALRPPEVMTPARVDFASASSPAIRTVVASSPTVPAARVPAKVVLKALSDPRLGQRGGDLGGGRAVGRDDQRVEGLEVQRVGDVDDDLAGEAVAALGDDVGDGGVGDGEDDDVAGDRGGDVARRRAAGRCDRPWPATAAMAWPMLPVPMMERCAMKCSW